MEFLLIFLLAVVGVFLFYKIMFSEHPSLTQIGSETSTSPVANNITVVNKASGTVTDHSLDFAKDEKVNSQDFVELVKNTRTRVKKEIDQDKDVKITAKDAKVTSKKGTEKVETTLTKVEEVKKKRPGRKPKSQT
jgi:hypothetical protein